MFNHAELVLLSFLLTYFFFILAYQLFAFINFGKANAVNINIAGPRIVAVKLLEVF